MKIKYIGIMNSFTACSSTEINTESTAGYCSNSSVRGIELILNFTRNFTYDNDNLKYYYYYQYYYH
jgi:hypothetical protein